jgi:hypothetical protein
VWRRRHCSCAWQHATTRPSQRTTHRTTRTPQASAEERKRLEHAYKEKLSSVERRLKDLGDKEKAAKRSAAQLVRARVGVLLGGDAAG